MHLMWQQIDNEILWQTAVLTIPSPSKFCRFFGLTDTAGFVQSPCWSGTKKWGVMECNNKDNEGQQATALKGGLMSSHE